MNTFVTGALRAQQQSPIRLVPTGQDPFETARDRETILSSAGRVDAEALVAKLEAEHPEAMNALRATSVHPERGEPQLNLYLSSLPVSLAQELQGVVQELGAGSPNAKLLEPDRYDNIGLHCCVVGAGSEVLAKMLFQDDGARIKRATVLGIVHDANKASEIQKNKLSQALHLIETKGEDAEHLILREVRRALEEFQPGLVDALMDPYGEESYRQFATFLQKRGVHESHVDLVLKAGSVTGHGSFSMLVESGQSYKEVGYRLNTTMPEALIVHTADDHTSSPFGRGPSTLLTPRDRMVASEFATRYKWMFNEGISAQSLPGIGGENLQFEVVDCKNVSRPPAGSFDAVSYMEFQPILAVGINQWLMEMTGNRNGDPETFVRDVLTQALS